MLSQAIGSVLALAMAVALSPFPVIGVVLILSGTHGRRNGPLFAWMASLQDASPGRAVVLGLLLSGGNPKNAVLTAAAVTAAIETGVHGAELAAAVAVFVVLGSSTVLGAVVASLLGGPGAAATLERVRVFMVAHSAAIMVFVLLVLGASVLGGGLDGLGR
ncbi:GAP family protein [Cellulomonas sp. McL0617]|uniref:GAP family protein n=1 Tax=Cellulomonas sp. McL0617 TaxID=3415675 RepID=UPI003CEF17D0